MITYLVIYLQTAFLPFPGNVTHLELVSEGQRSKLQLRDSGVIGGRQIDYSIVGHYFVIPGKKAVVLLKAGNPQFSRYYLWFLSKGVKNTARWAARV